MGLDDPLDDTQAQAAAFNLAAVGFITSIESVEHARQDGWRNSFASIADGQHDLRGQPHEV